MGALHDRIGAALGRIVSATGATRVRSVEAERIANRDNPTTEQVIAAVERLEQVADELEAIRG